MSIKLDSLNKKKNTLPPVEEMQHLDNFPQWEGTFHP